MRVLGIDYGEKNIGLALGDTLSKVASPWGVILNEGIVPVISKLQDIVSRDLVKVIVVGIPRPLHDAGYENEQVKEIRKFISDLGGLGVKIIEEDEALSSRLAAKQVSSMGEKGKRDDLAATAILQTWLDRSTTSK